VLPEVSSVRSVLSKVEVKPEFLGSVLHEVTVELVSVAWGQCYLCPLASACCLLKFCLGRYFLRLVLPEVSVV
jgi:hypothetical protein